MMELTIRRFPDPFLRRPAKKIDKVTEAERTILADMAETMYLKGGVGLAAVQVGIDKHMAVVDTGSGIIKMVNPAILKKDGAETEEEGCLSVPGRVVKVKRAKNIVVNFMDEKGEAVQLRAEGLLARAIQHELDHLSGILIIDYSNPLKRLFLKKKMAA